MLDEFYLPEPDVIRKQSLDNKQGRDEELPAGIQQKFLERLKLEQSNVYGNYEAAIEDDVARELARINLPLSLYTQWYWQIDLHNLFHFLNLRMDAHAQHEIRVYADVMADMVRRVTPYAYEAFENHVLYAKNISRPTLEKLESYLKSNADKDETAAELLKELKK